MTDSELYQLWEKNRGIIRSRKGGWRVGSGVFSHGYNLLEDLAGKSSYFQVMVLHATGRLPERKFADWLEAAFICLSWPDHRIWCNQIGSLGGTLRASVVASTSAGILAGDSRLYAQKPLLEGMEFIQRALNLHKSGLSPKEIVLKECEKFGGKPKLMGFARPIAKGDERVITMERITSELGFPIGPHLSLAYDIEKFLMEEFEESMNINGYASAFVSDHGYTPKETYQFAAFLVASGVTACFLDTLDRPAESFLPMHCDDIDYEGPPPRPVPERD